MDFSNFHEFFTKVVKWSHGNLFRLAVILCSMTAVLSAFLDNVTTMILIAPVTIEVILFMLLCFHCKILSKSWHMH